MSSKLKCANCKDYLFLQPMQCLCGDRLCGKCYQQYKDRSVNSLHKKEIAMLLMRAVARVDRFRVLSARASTSSLSVSGTEPSAWSWRRPPSSALVLTAPGKEGVEISRWDFYLMHCYATVVIFLQQTGTLGDMSVCNHPLPLHLLWLQGAATQERNEYACQQMRI